jgi:putative endonuclease
MARQYYVCIMTNRSRTLYVGVTNDLERRVHEHKSAITEGFTKRYKINRLVYFDATPDVEGAISREQEIKRWRRSKKIGLIEASNPGWKDLAEGWYEVGP